MEVSHSTMPREELHYQRMVAPIAVPHVLIVDDDAGIRQSIEQLLKQNYPTLLLSIVASAEEAIGLLKHNQFSLLIADLKLPAIDGMQLIRATKSHFPNLKAMLLTAYGNEAICHMAKTLGCESYLEKPFSAPEFLIHVSRNLCADNSMGQNFSLRNLIQLLKHNERSGTSAMYLLESPHASALVAIERGIVTQAYIGASQGFEAFEKILSLKDAQIRELPLVYGGKNLLAINWSLLWVVSHIRSEEKKLQLLKSPI